MSNLRLNALPVLLAVCATTAPRAAAQKPNEVRPAPAAYLIEIEREGRCSFAPVKGPSARGSLLFTVPRANGNAPDVPGQPSVSAVTTTAERDGELWRVNVVVNLGEFYDAGTRPVASYTTRAGASVSVQGDGRFGPFRVRVVKGFGGVARAPRVVNRTPSVAVDKIEVGELPEPYRFSFKNNSGTGVLAVQLNAYERGRHQFLKWLEATHMLPLIKPGGFYPMEVPSMNHTCAGPDGHITGQSDAIEIASAVFADGSYEGEAGLAALIKGRALGNVKNLARAVDALNNLSRRSDPGAAEVISYLEGEAAAMEEVPEESVLVGLLASFPALDSHSALALNSFVRHGMHEVKMSLSDDARKWTAAAGGKTEGDKDVRAWLEQKSKKYEGWLARARAVAGRE